MQFAVWTAVRVLLQNDVDTTLQEENFHGNFSCAISLIANSINFNSTDYIFRILSMIVYTIEIQISKFANIKFCDLDQSEPGRQIKFRVCFFYLIWNQFSAYRTQLPL